MNTLALRADLSGTPTFRELLARVRKSSVAAFAHQDMPFDRLVEELRPERNASYAPIVQVLFGIMPKDHRVFEFEGVSIERMNVDLGTARFDLSLMMSEEQGVLEGTLEYSTDLFDEDTVRRMMTHFEHLLEGVSDNPDQRIDTIALMDAEQRHKLVADWNDTATDWPGERCIHDIFDERATEHPARRAVTTDDDSLTYGQLKERSDRLAARLCAAGVAGGAPVGLCLTPGNDAVVAMLGILKAGGAYLPLDPEQPAERLHFQFQDAGICVVVTEAAHRTLVSDFARCTIMISEDDDLSRPAPEMPTAKLDGSTPAYVLFTSGSTGSPKGVVVPHRAVSRLVLSANYVPLDAESIVLWSSPISFDAATFEIWGPLLNGGECIVLPDKIPSFDRLGSVIRDHRVTTLFLTAALFNVVIDESPETLGAARYVIVGGEPLSVQHMRRARRLLPATQFINGYGPTETTTFAACHPIGDADVLTAGIPLGRPISNTTIYVVDGELEPVPLGVVGEICIGGPGVALEYLNRPELTASKFIPDPFSSEPEARVFRTGDLGKIRPDGNLEYVGRRDHQVKIRGHRIELAEIEAVCAEKSGVKSAAVVRLNCDPGRGELGAFIRTAPGTPDGFIEDLPAYLKSRLPRYMIPRFIAAMDTFPLTDTGKLDRSALERVQWTDDEDDETEPITATEAVVAEIYREVLGERNISPRADFFSLGGHSLTAMQLTNRIEMRLGVPVSILTVFENPTTRDLAAALDVTLGAQASDKPVGPGVEIESVAPIVPK